ncbi:hypothetical protein CGCF415_v006800 [Colletotrichum fructicola]|uniref:Uncharacterized protein n=2 Tax=Colletotrichum gloeosporioides species complex TaxID=2707338 RepID=L2G3K1_COLFN|nr:uncharacterized protein CGMCC3_g1671 [Colletotrichum fructicola]XP_053030516.1 uncharacterized protein COL26b_012894 [Colletotrichum chrysophilum]KAF4484423.1 hypothetical protein CGGC5_v008397 [Colletotrichum fructicola Nara gc5]KAI8292566.1 hypothetical protein K4K60_003395 [Colletotrichum sp. SAR11_57]KAE9582356.1 hypothetical protein CGMCC3_g1671 [Colletotrichum fructicola]KAF4431207.1 hypothetical protein CFRS1_v008828 [Colletotrichum fructicola]KAF4895850.1 hypothetical protein CGCFR
MRFSTITVVLQAAALAQAATLPSPPSGQSIELVKDSVAPVSDTSIANLVERKEVTDVHAIETLAEQFSSADKDLVLRDLQKRTLNIKLGADTGNRYRATINGIAIIVHFFFDLAIEKTVFYWTIDGTNPAPGDLRLGFRDMTSGAGVPDARYAHDNRYYFPGFRLYDVINIFKP